jgi:hypothetical protein
MYWLHLGSGGSLLSNRSFDSEQLETHQHNYEKEIEKTGDESQTP